MTVFTDEKEKRRIAREKVAYRRSAEEEVRRRWDRIGCHEEHDRSLNPDKRDRLRWHALTRLCAAESIPLSLLVDRTPEGAARAVEDWLKERERAG